MPRRIWMVVITALVVAALGCATKRAIPDLPSALEPDEGLLVARLYVLGMQGIENASIEIDGTLKSSAMRDGYIAIPLPAGEHKLSRLENRLIFGEDE